MVKVLINEEYGFRFWLFFFPGSKQELKDKWIRDELTIPLPISNWTWISNESRFQEACQYPQQGKENGLIFLLRGEEDLQKAAKIVEAFIDLENHSLILEGEHFGNGFSPSVYEEFCFLKGEKLLKEIPHSCILI